MRYADRLLPNQHTFCRLFEGDDVMEALFDCISRASAFKTYKLEQSPLYQIEDMGSNLASLRLIQILMRLAGVKRVLEIGTFIGLSTMHFAEIAEQVVTIEKFLDFAKIAIRNFETNGFENIQLHGCDARNYFPTEKFDMVFIDGNKEHYLDHFRRFESPLMIVDDCFFCGDVLNPKTSTYKGQGVKEFMDYAATRGDYLKLALPLGNGIMIMVKNVSP